MSMPQELLRSPQLSNLSPRERHALFELMLLAEPEERYDETLRVRIPKGCAVVSWPELEKRLGLTRSAVRRTLSRLVEAGLIELTPVGGPDDVGGARLCRIKFSLSAAFAEADPLLSPAEAVFRLELLHLQERLAALEMFRKDSLETLSSRDRHLIDLLIEAYRTAVSSAASGISLRER
jgi:DNA-binding transcriptional ArsR family regulator